MRRRSPAQVRPSMVWPSHGGEGKCSSAMSGIQRDCSCLAKKHTLQLKSANGRGIMKSGIAAIVLASGLLSLPWIAHAQTYSKTETIEYHDDTALWVIGQLKRTTTSGIETSRTEFGWKALPWKTYSF